MRVSVMLQLEYWRLVEEGYNRWLGAAHSLQQVKSTITHTSSMLVVKCTHAESQANVKWREHMESAARRVRLCQREETTMQMEMIDEQQLSNV